MQTAPIPPLPPLPSEMPVVIAGGGPPEWVGFVAIASLVVGGFLLFPLVRALARRIEGRGGAEELRGEIDAVHERLAETERLEARVAELESRLEFSERLLSQHREQLLERQEGG